MRFLFAARLLAAVGLWFMLGPAMGQKSATRTAYEQFAKEIRTSKPLSVTCQARYDNKVPYYIGPPEAYLKALGDKNARVAAVQSSTFIVTYKGFTPQAQAAFQKAVDIWQSLIKSPIPIRVDATWRNFSSPSTLGAAAPTGIYTIAAGQKAGWGYPVALAEKITRRDLNNGRPDIVADFNSAFTWYLGTEGKPTIDQFDFTTVVLHELGHGLGFYGGGYVLSGNLGGIDGFIYDTFVENQQGQKLIDQSLFAQESAALYNQLVSGNLFFNGPVVQQKTGERAKLYAPTKWNNGSSYAHLDDKKYPAGNINNLMTPFATNGIVTLTPGPVTLAMFEDMEWKTTSIVYDNSIRDAEAIIDRPVNVTVVSDTTLVPSSVQLFIGPGTSTTSVAGFTAVTMNRVGNTDQYTYTIPASLATGKIRYYFQARDATGRTVTNPGKTAPSGIQVTYRANFGVDNVPPTLSRVGLRTGGLFTSPTAFTGTGASSNYYVVANGADTLNISAIIKDDRTYGIDTAYVEYQINGVAQTPKALRYSVQFRELSGNTEPIDSVYTTRLQFAKGALAAGGKIAYRIVAIDSSRAQNKVFFPATGFSEIAVVAPQATVRTSYTNDFANPTTAAADFAMNGFNIGQPSGFQSPLLQSNHPYQNGNTFDYENNTSALLLAPIRVKAPADSATIRFDEVALVEPGSANTQFGDAEFFDYVIVEGSKNNGITWQYLIEGYDASAKSEWSRAWNSSIIGNDVNQVSNGVGTTALLKRREVRILDGLVGGVSNFKANDVILIRFRLYADQGAYGWGWALDNLQVQVAPPPPVLAVEPGKPTQFSVYPNPSSNGVIRVEAQLAKAVSEVGITLTSPMGQTIKSLSLPVRGTVVNEQVDLGQLPTGLYFLQLKAGETLETKKIMITR